jgi:hypothetical protein
MFAFLVWCLIVGAPIIIWLLFRSGGYKRRPLETPPGPDWKPNGERFLDPTSGEALEVWTSPAGERAYVRARIGRN